MAVRATRVRRLRIRRAIRRTTLAVVVLTSGMLYISVQKDVTLVVDGRPQAVRTLSGNVAQLLAAKGIRLSGVEVTPSPSTSLSDGMVVVVESAPPPASVAAEVQASDVGVWVMDGVSGPLAKLAGRPTELGLSVVPSSGALRITAARIVVAGKEHDVLTNAATVRELLSAMGINPDTRDRVLPSLQTPLLPGIDIRFTDVEVRVKEVRKDIPFNTVTTYSEELSPGEVRIVQTGQPGTLQETYRIRKVNGRVVSRVCVGKQVLEPAVPQQRVVGTVLGGHGSQAGEASWYDAPGTGFTAAHPSLAYGTKVTVTNVATGESVVVTINDRGPFGGRVIDLSPEAFSALAPLGQGVMQVRLSW